MSHSKYRPKLTKLEFSVSWNNFFFLKVRSLLPNWNLLVHKISLANWLQRLIKLAMLEPFMKTLRLSFKNLKVRKAIPKVSAVIFQTKIITLRSSPSSMWLILDLCFLLTVIWSHPVFIRILSYAVQQYDVTINQKSVLVKKYFVNFL